MTDIDERIERLNADVALNRKFLQAILSSFLNNRVQFEDTGYDKYYPDFTYGVDDAHKYPHSDISTIIVEKAVCEKTGGTYDWENQKCKH